MPITGPIRAGIHPSDRIEAVCLSCKKVWKAARKYVGQTAKCRVCGGVVAIPFPPIPMSPTVFPLPVKRPPTPAPVDRPPFASEETTADRQHALATLETFTYGTLGGMAVIGLYMALLVSGIFPFWLGYPACAAFYGAMASCFHAKFLIKEMRFRLRSRAHERWLLTAEGRVWQDAENEKSRRLAEEAEHRRREAEEQEARCRKEAEEQAARFKWQQFHESKTMDQISRMTGLEFERFLARLLRKMGYGDVSLTSINDQGGDILCRPPTGSRTVVQAKRWKGSVGNGAVQELLGAMLFYGCHCGIVVTNSRFTEPALALARKDNRITLYDGAWVEEQTKKFLPRRVPEFTWEEYNRMATNWQPGAAGGRKAKKRRRRRRRACVR